MWVLDTSIVSHIQYGSGTEYDRIRVRLEAVGDVPVVATVPGMEEQFRGRIAVCHKARTADEYVTAAAYLRRTFDFYVGLPVLDFDDRAAAEYGRLKRAKVRIGTQDLRIAAIVKSLDATLITRNLSDFRKVPHLKAEDWSRPV